MKLKSGLLASTTIAAVYLLAILVTMISPGLPLMFGSYYRIDSHGYLVLVMSVVTACLSLLIPSGLIYLYRDPQAISFDSDGERGVMATLAEAIQPSLRSAISGPMILIVLAGVSFEIWNFGIHDIFYRSVYLEERFHLGSASTILVSLSRCLSYFTALICGVVIYNAPSRIVRTLAWITLLECILFHFGKSGRGLPLSFIELVLAREFSPERSHRWGFRIAGIALAVVSFGVVIYNRETTGMQGVYAYINEDARLLCAPGEWGNAIERIGAAVAIPLPAFDLTYNTYLPQRTFNLFMMAVTPLSAKASGWAAIKSDMRLNYYSPFAGLAELAVWGIPVISLYYVVCGSLLCFAESLVAKRWKLGVLVIWSLSVLFALQAPQYSLRMQTRVVYIAMLFATCVVGCSALRDRRSDELFDEDEDPVDSPVTFHNPAERPCQHRHASMYRGPRHPEST